MEGCTIRGGRCENFLYVKNNMIHYQLISILDFVDNELIIVSYIRTNIA